MKISLGCGGLRLVRRVSKRLAAQDDRKSADGSVGAAGALRVSGEGGGALIEFALVLPLMVMLITGMASFGLAISNYLILTSSVDSGARALSLARGQTSPALAASNPCAYAVQVANNSSPSLNPSSLTYSIAWTTINASGTSVTTTYSNASCAGLALNAGDSVQVKAVYPFTIILYGWKPGALNMVSQTSELVQ
jgi:Flp pilus assembly protein TadG